MLKPPSFSAMHRLLSISIAAVFLVLASGCSMFHVNGTSTPPSVGITANPTSINAGASATLTITATNATQVTVTGTDGSSYTLNSGGGTQTVNPSATTTYTATATGTGGQTQATAIVTVNAPPPPTVSISANPTTINSGSSSTLTVTATNATQVTVSGTDGSSYTLQPNGGTQTVSPTSTTTYTATASGSGGKAIASATVTVNATPPPGAPTVSISANPTTIAQGSSSTLTVTATNATQVTITGTDGSSYTLQPTGGTQSVNPSATTTYTATATGSGGSAKQSVTVTVSATPPPPAAPTVSISANPTTITQGSSSTLTVSATNATQVTVTGTDGSSYTLQANGGTQTVSPASTTTYTATATGSGGSAKASATVTVNPPPPAAPTVSITANPTTITSGASSTLTVTATNATQVTVTGTDGSSYTLSPTGGTQKVSPTATTTYTATATGTSTNATAQTTVTVEPAANLQSIKHVIFMLQENHSFDNYMGMLNVYRHDNNMFLSEDGNEYDIDGLVGCAPGSDPCTTTYDKTLTVTNDDDEGTSYSLFKLKSTCIDDDSSDWLASYGDVNRYNFLTTRPIQMSGFVHTAEGFAKSCNQPGATCSGQFTDTTGQRAMGYYDDGFLNYYYYMASQFAVDDRWFSPVSSKSIDNRIATFSGGTTQGLVKDPGNDHLPQLNIETIFQELDNAGVSWKIYFTDTQGFCLDYSSCPTTGNSRYPATDFSSFSYSTHYLYQPAAGASCTAPTQPSSVVGDSTNSYCIDPNHIAWLSQYYTDLANGTLPSFAFIEAGYGHNDEHPGSGQTILNGQAQVANILNAFMSSSSWSSSVFFLSYDEGGGPYDHVPPVPGHSNDYTDPSLGSIPDISSIAVNPDSYFPCVPPTPGTPTTHCDLGTSDPGANPGDAPAQQGFAAQIGFRVPNMIISPFVRRHYVSHTPMDHTAIIKFVENRFINSSAHLTARDAAQPNLLDMFDFTNVPWATPPTPPTPYTDGGASCTPQNMGP